MKDVRHMAKIVTIQCKSLLQVASELLKYQYSYHFATEHHEVNGTYLYLSLKTNTFFDTPINQALCYSLRYDIFNKTLYPYKLLADIISSLPYRFTIAEDNIDKYQIKRIILRN